MTVSDFLAPAANVSFRLPVAATRTPERKSSPATANLSPPTTDPRVAAACASGSDALPASLVAGALWVFSPGLAFVMAAAPSLTLIRAIACDLSSAVIFSFFGNRSWLPETAQACAMPFPMAPAPTIPIVVILTVNTHCEYSLEIDFLKLVKESCWNGARYPSPQRP